jgi:T3SS negative regulator,GrlR
MVEGLWIAQYQGLNGSDCGVVVFVNGRVLGGDNACTYIGNYSVQNGIIKANVRINFFRSDVQSVLHLPGDAELRLEAPVSDHLIEGGMNVVGEAGAGIVVRLTKKANL